MMIRHNHYATLQGMDIRFLPLREKIHNFYKNASILIYNKTKLKFTQNSLHKHL